MAKKTPLDPILYALTFFVLFFAAVVLSSQIIFRSELVTLPNLAGKTVEEARTALAGMRTGLAVQGIRFDSRIEKGRIVSQDPGPNSRMKAKRTVNVVLSDGTERLTVPALEGRSLEYAAQTLKLIGLRRGRVSQIHTPRYAAGRIIAQWPAPGEAAGRSSAVDFLVSQGAWEPSYVMPDLIEKSAAPVLARLKAIEFQIAEVHYSYYPGLGPGIILKQSPVHGTRIQKRNQITLEVSK
jgi:eukaryotic-like serine/threonine-protein kinase